jgi:hypothetical protein
VTKKRVVNVQRIWDPLQPEPPYIQYPRVYLGGTREPGTWIDGMLEHLEDLHCSVVDTRLARGDSGLRWDVDWALRADLGVFWFDHRKLGQVSLLVAALRLGAGKDTLVGIDHLHPLVDEGSIVFKRAGWEWITDLDTLMRRTREWVVRHLPEPRGPHG